MEEADNSKQTYFPKSELREYEQYFFSENMLKQITDSLQYEDKILCLCTPAVADAFWRFHKKEVLCLDIDERFNYLPQFKKCDITKINELPLDKDYAPNVIIVDPPFFKMNLLIRSAPKTCIKITPKLGAYELFLIYLCCTK